MNKVVAWLEGEPAVVTSVIGTAATLGAAFGLHVTTDQLAAVTSSVGVIVGLVIRSNVTPTAKADAPVAAALAVPVPVPAPVVVAGTVIGQAGKPPT